MTKLKALVYVDVSNIYHSLKKSNLLQAFDYKDLIDLLRKKYDIAKVCFYDASKSIKQEPTGYSKQQRFHQKLQKKIPEVTIKSRKLKYVKVDHKVETEKKKLKLCNNCNFSVDKFLQDAGLVVISKEKGVDVLLATDLIKDAFRNKYDIALLVSGDSDFVPAVDLVQSLKKQVVNVHLYAGSSSELRNACDSHTLIQIDKNDGKMHLR